MDPKTDPTPGFRAELMEAIASLDKQIMGLTIILGMPSLSPELTRFVEKALEIRETRRGLANDEILAMNVVLEKQGLLFAHGYPGLPQVEIPQSIADELARESAALAAAMAIFEAELRAAMMKINLGVAPRKES